MRALAIPTTAQASVPQGVPVSPSPSQDRLYWFDLGCYVYVTSRCVFPLTARPYAVLLFSVDGAPMRLDAGGKSFVGSALAVAPQTARRLGMSMPGLISVNVSPISTHFPAFRAIAASGVCVLERGGFAAFEATFAQLHRGASKPPGASATFAALLAAAQAQLPPVPPMDARVPRMLELISARHDITLAEVAQAFAISYHRASHVLSSSLGLSFKAYQAWRKQERVCKLLYSGASLTTIAYEAELSDSAHLSRYYQQWFGQSPSYSRNRTTVRTFA